MRRPTITVTAPLVGSAIAKIIDARSRRPVTVTETRLAPARDAKGDIALDARGNVITERIEKTDVRELHAAPQENSTAELKFGSILSFSMGSGGKSAK